MPGAWDALSARLAGEAGFSTVFLSGYCVSGTQLGLPDHGFLTQTEMAIERAKAAADTGVDAVFVEAPESVAEMERPEDRYRP